MGSKSSSSASTTQNLQQDNRVVAGDGAAVLGDGAYYSSNYVEDRSLTQLSYDASNHVSVADNSSRYSYADNSFKQQNDNSVRLTDSHNQTTNIADNSSRYADNSYRSADDNSIRISDSRDLSTSNYNLDSSNRSTTTTNITGTDPGVVRLGEINAAFLTDVNAKQTDAVKFMANAGADFYTRLASSATNLQEQAGSNAASVWEKTMNVSDALMGRVIDAATATNANAAKLADLAVTNYQPADKASGNNTVLIVAVVAAVLVLPSMLKH